MKPIDCTSIPPAAAIAESYQGIAEVSVDSALDDRPDLAVLIDDDPPRFARLYDAAQRDAGLALWHAFPVVIRPTDRVHAFRVAVRAAGRSLDGAA